MHVEAIREYCLSKPGTTEGFPFGENVLVFKVGGKMYALMPLDQADRINLKCDPDRAIELRAAHPDGIFPGYHMSKTHWNTVHFAPLTPAPLVYELIDHSYALIFQKLPQKVQAEIAESSAPQA